MQYKIGKIMKILPIFAKTVTPILDQPQCRPLFMYLGASYMRPPRRRRRRPRKGKSPPCDCGRRNRYFSMRSLDIRAAEKEKSKIRVHFTSQNGSVTVVMVECLLSAEDELAAPTQHTLSSGRKFCCLFPIVQHYCQSCASVGSWGGDKLYVQV
jgi:hypothetical protein